jgi:hypothetical protein
MKLLPNENLKLYFPEHEIRTVRELGWNGYTNGRLLNLMIENGFEVLITFDKNLQHQQNFLIYPIMVIVLSAPSNQYKHLSPLSDLIQTRLQNIEAGVSVISNQ